MYPHIEPVSPLSEVLPLLKDCGLPVSDLAPDSPPLFFGVRSGDGLVAVVGLEIFGAVGLLRSLAVAPGHRGRGLGRALAAFVEDFAAGLGVERLFLLTTTAEAFFARLGYGPTPRESAPEAIRATAQFAALCPASSAFMAKRVVPGGRGAP